MPGPDAQISVRAGTAEPVAMELPPGQAIGPLSIGRGGTWRVVAPGVLEEHAFLYFNGSELFLQSADANSPVTVNGSPIPSDWTPIYAPCEIAFGNARLWFGPTHQPARSKPPPVPSRPPPGPARAPQPIASVPRELPSQEESTRQVSIEAIQSAIRRPPPPEVSATLKSGAVAPSFGGAPPPSLSFGPAPLPSFGGAPQAFDAPTPLFGEPTHDAPAVNGPGPQFGPTPPGAPMAFVDPGAPPPEAVPAKPPSGIGKLWREASGPKKAMIILMAPLIWAVWVIFTDKPPPPRPAKAAPSATVSPNSTPAASAAATATSSAQPAVEPPTPVVAPTPTPSATASGKAAAGPTTSVKTREREAADAVAVGAYDKAARLYEELAKAHPETSAYAEAARIMKAKAGRR